MNNHAVAYLRTSSASNVGADKDSHMRQKLAVDIYASRNGIDIVDYFYDAAVSGVDPVESRPGFAAMLDRIEGNGVRVVLVEDASRFARDLVTQETGIVAMLARGVRVLTADGTDLTVTDDPFKVAIRQVAGVFAQLEKSRLVAKLKAGRDRKSAELGRRVEGGPDYARRRPEVVAALRELRQGQPDATLQELADGLAARGHTTSTGGKITATQVRRMLLAGAG